MRVQFEGGAKGTGGLKGGLQGRSSWVYAVHCTLYWQYGTGSLLQDQVVMLVSGVEAGALAARKAGAVCGRETAG